MINKKGIWKNAEPLKDYIMKGIY